MNDGEALEGLSGGCSRKLSQAELQELLDVMGSSLARISGDRVLEREDRVDACEIVLSAPSSRFVASTDLLYGVSSDRYRCGYIAGIHAFSDIFAVLGDPLWALVTVGVRSEDLREGRLVSLLRGVSDAVVAVEAVFAGAHSVRAEDLFVSVAAIGLASSWQRSKPEIGDLIVLSKPIGTGIALSAVKLGVAVEAEIQDVFASMMISNLHVARFLRSLLDTNPRAVRSVTDVSGYGLLSAVRQVAGGWRTSIQSSNVLTFENTHDLMGSGASSNLMDQNRLESERFTSYASSVQSPAALAVLLNDPQTSGGLLAVVKPGVCDASELAAEDLTIIGEVIGSPDRDELSCIVVD